MGEQEGDRGGQWEKLFLFNPTMLSEAIAALQNCPNVDITRSIYIGLNQLLTVSEPSWEGM